ncbi:MAG: hypothetical protein ACI4PQ_02010 [Butyricicoccaceae bacterium]
MVKGISRRVVLVRGLENDCFEQAIFIVRDGGADGCDILQEACDAAQACSEEPLRSVPRRRLTLAALCGGGVASALWALALLVVNFC